MRRFSRGILWISLLLVASSAGGLKAQWSETAQGVGPESQRIGAICFSHGVVWAGASFLFSSTDSGKTWNQSSSFPANEISDISFYDSLNGVVGTFQNGLFLTQDGGQSWSNVLQSNGEPFCRVAFNGSASIMHALDNTGIINSSTDGGSTWMMHAFGNEGLTFAIGADKTIYVFTSGTTGWINYSSDLGTTWSGNETSTDADSQGLAADSCDIRKLYLINENTRDRTGNTTNIDVTPDGGLSWQINKSHALDFYSGSIANTSQVIYVTTVPTSGSGVLRSTDAGASWQSIGGPTTSFDTRSIALANNNIIFVLDSNGNVWKTLNSGGIPLDLSQSGPGVPQFVISGNPERFQANVCGPLDSEIFLGVLSCLPTTATIDSVAILGSSSFTLNSSGAYPHTVAAGDSIGFRYWPISSANDTARIQIAYHLSGVARDTTILLLGLSSSKNSGNSAGAQRELVSSSYDASVGLRLLANVQPSINLDSIWPFLQSINVEFSYDSSQLTFSSYNPPSGWSTISSVNLGNAIEIKIRNVSSSSTQPLDMGTANFIPRSHSSSLTRLPLVYLVLNTSGGPVPLCIERQEDDIWAIEVYPTSGVAEDMQQEEDIQVFPNPAENELWVRNTSDFPAMVMLSDALGRELITETIPENTTGKLDLESLASSSYILTCHVNDRTFIRRVAKLR